MNKRALVIAIPLVIVNSVSIIAQFEFIRDHLPTWIVPGQVLLAIAVESLALTMSFFYFEAVTAGDSAFALKAASLAYGFLIGFINASHYLQHGRITAAAIMVGLLSASSPILWNTYTKRQSRDILLSKGLISPHAVRLGITRIFWHPIKSVKVFRVATWNVDPDLGPKEVIDLWESSGVKPDGKRIRRQYTDNGDSAEIRSWAKANGHSVSERGRIPDDVRKAYESRNNSPVKPRVSVSDPADDTVIFDKIQADTPPLVFADGSGRATRSRR